MFKNKIFIYKTSYDYVFSHFLKFNPNGNIEGYNHFNERYWRIDDDQIVILNGDKEPTIRLDILYKKDKRIVLQGPFLLSNENGAVRIFEEVQPAKLSYPISFNWLSDFASFFREKGIFLARPNRIEDVFAIGTPIYFDNEVLVEPYATMPEGFFISMGSFSYALSPLTQFVTIGRYCSIAANVKVMPPRHPLECISTSTFTHDPVFEETAREYLGDPTYRIDFDTIRASGGFGKEEFYDKRLKIWKYHIEIGNDVWIGEDVILKRGIKIGHGAIIGIRAVVTKDVPPYAIVGGVPARILRYRFPKEIITRMLQLKWWDYKYTDLPKSYTKPQKFLDELEILIKNKKINKFVPEKINIAQSLLDISFYKKS